MKYRETTIAPSRGLFHFDLVGVLQYRDLLWLLVKRDIQVRYKQAAIGVFWAVLQPLLTMVLFTIIFGKLAKINSDGLPYAVFSFTALLPWNYFAAAITRSGTSLVSNAGLISKVYFPRLIVPLAAVLSPLLDFAISFVILLLMMVWYGITPTWGVLLLPLFLALAVVVAFASCLFLAALNVQYRDVGHALPFLVQLWMYACPVVYSISLVPDKWRWLYSLNPMVGVIEGFRWALLGKAQPDFGAMAISSAMVVVLLFGGLVYFKRMERMFADVI